MGFCSFLWAWNYWMIHLRISLMQMNKGLECVLGQFTDGTSWEKSSAHCRNLLLKSSWKAAELIWNDVQQEQVRSLTQHISQQEGEKQAWWQESSEWQWRQELCCAAKAHPTSLLGCMTGTQVWEMHSSPFSLPHHNVQPQKREKSNQND